MIRQGITIILALIAGLVIESNVFHGADPSVIAPDFLVILVVYVGLTQKSPWGAGEAFLLGLASDFATGKWIGPNAAGAVLAFCLTVEISNRIFAERGPAVIVVAFLASLVKLVISALMIMLYSDAQHLTAEILGGMLFEAVFTAAIAPLVLRLFAMRYTRSHRRGVTTMQGA